MEGTERVGKQGKMRQWSAMGNWQRGFGIWWAGILPVLRMFREDICSGPVQPMPRLGEQRTPFWELSKTHSPTAGLEFPRATPQPCLMARAALGIYSGCSVSLSCFPHSTPFSSRSKSHFGGDCVTHAFLCSPSQLEVAQFPLLESLLPRTSFWISLITITSTLPLSCETGNTIYSCVFT